MDKLLMFKSKGQNLLQLMNKVKKAKICKVFIFTVSEWRNNKKYFLNEITKHFFNDYIIIRSSSPNEDSSFCSMAGVYKSLLNINSNNTDNIIKSVEEIINSYTKVNGDNIDDYEILIQPILKNVKLSGVILTRDIENYGPYYLINYDDETYKTDTITSGSSKASKMLKIYKRAKMEYIDNNICKIIEMARELESIFNNDALDIEFAIDNSNDLYIFQVRPLVVKIKDYNKNDDIIDIEINNAKKFFYYRSTRKPNLYGNTTILSEMADWNPAEIIGIRPKPLAYSLYKFIFMKNIWREGRKIIGYNNPCPHDLMVSIGVHPYVDVRNDFNSLLPYGLKDDLANKLIDYYISELRKKPELHDKVEFDIVITCLAFDFDMHCNRLSENGFSDAEICDIKNNLFHLTNNIINDTYEILTQTERKVEELISKRNKILSNKVYIHNIPHIVGQLLEDCIEYGAIPFTVFVRCAFIGSAFLRSLVNTNIISVHEYSEFLKSIPTITSEYVEDLGLYVNGLMDIKSFLKKYGHLRPGTYDINTFSYNEMPSLYLPNNYNKEYAYTNITSKRQTPFDFDNKVKNRISDFIKKFEFTFSAENLIKFIKDSFKKREYIKFEFTKNISLALNLIGDFGHYYGLSREDMSFLKIDDFLQYTKNNNHSSLKNIFKNLIDKNREKYYITAQMNLPDLIFSNNDFEAISLQERKPNYVTQKSITAQCIRLINYPMEMNHELLWNKIILIENADPGYEWLFSLKISGIITKYGGAASHMTLRCSELGIPAAIGCGEYIFSNLEKANYIKLNCLEKRIDIFK